MIKQNERNLILEVCKFRNINKVILEELCNDKLNEPYLLGQLLFHRLGGIAYGVLCEAELIKKLSRETRSSLNIIYEAYKIKTDSFIKSLDYLSDIFCDLEIPVALLKGAQLVQLYPKGYRTSNDIDILLSDDNITKVSEILKKNSFKQGKVINNEFEPASRKEIIFSRMNKGETIPYIKEINLPWMKHLEIDINFTLDYKAKSDFEGKDIVNNILNNLKPLYGNLYTLTNDDFIIHLCSHLYKEATTYPWVKMRRDISLYKYSDLYNLLLLEEFNSKTLPQRINELNLNKECYYSFYYTKLLFGVNTPYLNEILDLIKPECLDFMNEIIVPGKGKKAFNEDYLEWVFINDRENYLKDVIENV